MKHTRFKGSMSSSKGIIRGIAKVTVLPKFESYYNKLVKDSKDIYMKFQDISNKIDYISNVFTTKLYIKHRSTAISEIRYLTNIYKKNKYLYDETIYMVYIGGSSIQHLYYNAMFFPGIKFIIFGSNEFEGLDGKTEYEDIDYIYLKCKSSKDTEDNIVTYLNGKIVSSDTKNIASINNAQIKNINEDIINCILSTNYNLYIFEADISVKSINKLKTISRNIYMIHNKILDKDKENFQLFNKYQSFIQIFIYYLLDPKTALLTLDISTDTFRHEQIINNATKRGYHLSDIYSKGLGIITVEDNKYYLPENSIIYLKPYNNFVSLTTNVEVDGIITKLYLLNTVDYMNRLSYHNLFIRVFKSFTNPYSNFKIGYDNSYDCSYESQVYVNYLTIRADTKFISEAFIKSLTLIKIQNIDMKSINLTDIAGMSNKININTPYFKNDIHGFVDDNLTSSDYNNLYRRYYEVAL